MSSGPVERKHISKFIAARVTNPSDSKDAGEIFKVFDELDANLTEAARVKRNFSSLFSFGGEEENTDNPLDVETEKDDGKHNTFKMIAGVLAAIKLIFLKIAAVAMIAGRVTQGGELM